MTEPSSDGTIILKAVITIKKVYITNILPLLNKDVYEYYYARVGEYRQKKADKLISEIDKARSVGAGAVLRFAIEDSTDYNYDKLNFAISKNGKPYVKNNPFYFSLSHSGDYAVCAISDTPIGIDIEQERELTESFKKRFADSILDWTKKEAKGKLTGNGFFDTSNGDFIYTHKKIDGYIITVCSDEEVTEFLYYHLPFPG